MENKSINLPESFIRNCRMSAEARQLYMIYTLLGEYSREMGWINKYDEPYIHVTHDLLAKDFGFYTEELDKLHAELVGLNLVQSRDRSEAVDEYSLVIRQPKDTKVELLIPEMPRTIKRSKKTLMYQWRAFIRKMALTQCEQSHPLMLHIYCDVMIPSVLAQQTTKELREQDLLDFTYLGYLQPRSIIRILGFLDVRVSRNALKACMRKLSDAGLVKLSILNKRDMPTVLCGQEEHEKAWDLRIKKTRYAYVVALPQRGEKDYSVFFSNPEEYSKLIEQVSSGVPKV